MGRGLEFKESGRKRLRSGARFDSRTVQDKELLAPLVKKETKLKSGTSWHKYQ